MSDRCKSCGAPVWWLRSDKTDKAAPIDPMPNDDGNVVILSGDRYRVLTKGEQDQPVAEVRHTNHFQTCPDRDNWRAKKQ